MHSQYVLLLSQLALRICKVCLPIHSQQTHVKQLLLHSTMGRCWAETKLQMNKSRSKNNICVPPVWKGMRVCYQKDGAFLDGVYLLLQEVSTWSVERERESERERKRERERVCVCECVRERARERKNVNVSVCMCMYLNECVSVCDWER